MMNNYNDDISEITCILSDSYEGVNDDDTEQAISVSERMALSIGNEMLAGCT